MHGERERERMRFRHRVACEILEQMLLPYLRLIKLQNCQDCCIATDLVKSMEDSVSSLVRSTGAGDLYLRLW